jgi:proteic killer suppression protein
VSSRHAGELTFYHMAVAGWTGGVGCRGQVAHRARLSRQLMVLNRSKLPQDMNQPGWGLHPLKGSESGLWAVEVNGNWRLTFAFEGEDAILVDYRGDYH